MSLHLINTPLHLINTLASATIIYTKKESFYYIPHNRSSLPIQTYSYIIRYDSPPIESRPQSPHPYSTH